ncbi:hypothetical protein [Heyndrickxia ginsengihumi]|uniref:hypothetical protein n=1 Tax=Heyndrickxia ginsengihumi TaxID=363870 RepID=UPI00046FFD9B|nr:hypothetical protein [Heyndrickxia ginsengihumi]
MDKDTFFTMPPSKRVQEVNKLLKGHDQKEISKLLDIPPSTFSKYMREGYYLYHKADKKYYPFVRSEEERVTVKANEESDENSFIKSHMDTLKKIVQIVEESGPLLLDKRIYDENAEIMNKNIRMNNEIYKEFSDFCKKYYPHLKMQDVFAQSLIDAMQKYKPEK